MLELAKNLIDHILMTGYEASSKYIYCTVSRYDLSRGQSIRIVDKKMVKSVALNMQRSVKGVAVYLVMTIQRYKDGGSDGFTQ